MSSSSGRTDKQNQLKMTKQGSDYMASCSPHGRKVTAWPHGNRMKSHAVISPHDRMAEINSSNTAWLLQAPMRHHAARRMADGRTLEILDACRTISKKPRDLFDPLYELSCAKYHCLHIVFFF